MPRLKPARLETVLDGQALRNRLSAAALAHLGDERAQRQAALEVLRQALFRGRMIAKERLENGAGGLDTARLLCLVSDEVVTALYDFTTVHMIRSRNPTEGERLSVVAVGGYGRGSLAPFSDLDLLFLRPYKTTAHAESVIEFMLYALWDLGFKVGHASRTVDECVKLAREDFTIRTSLLEGRYLTGDAPLVEELRRRFRADVVAGTAQEFVAAKLKERDDRHARGDASRYMVEPNVKEGKGGLRDLHTLFWIARYLHPEAKVADGVALLPEFSPRETRAFARAFDFLWAVRCHLHFATGRPEERLTFDLQPEVARRMGYGDRRGPHGEQPAVERFMKRYFLIAKEVGALTRAFSAQLEAEHFKKRPQGLSRFLPSMFVKAAGRRGVDQPGFFEEGGRLNVSGPEVFENDPLNLLRLFETADRRDLDLHPYAFTVVTRSLSLITPAMQRSEDAARLFLDILAHSSGVYRILTLMNDTGVLGRFVPEFGRVVGQTQFNMYHSYTVDEHTLRAVGVLGDVAAGRLKDDHPLASQILPLIADREALFLAMLLHDTGKGRAGDQETAGGRCARTACQRLGLTAGQTELVVWLVSHHLLMSDTAQKRDIADPRTVAAFAQAVETPERLRLLLALTVADIRAVGPTVWNGWKGQLLRDLYAATEAVFRGAQGAQGAASGAASARGHLQSRAAEARARLLQGAPEALPFVAAMDDSYFAGFTDAEMKAHAQVAGRARAAGAAAGAWVRPDRTATEAVVAARDRPRLFADLAEALAAMGAQVVGARVHTARTGEALDVFMLQDVSGAPFGGDAPAVLDRLCEALTAAALGRAPAAEARRPLDLGRSAAFAISPTVVIDAEAAEEATVVETSGRDRPGLLAALSRAVADAGLSVQSAHIEGFGERAVDVFYLQQDGGRVRDVQRLGGLKRALMEVLCETESEPAPKRRLQRARASIAR